MCIHLAQQNIITKKETNCHIEIIMNRADISSGKNNQKDICIL